MYYIRLLNSFCEINTSITRSARIVPNPIIAVHEYLYYIPMIEIRVRCLGKAILCQDELIKYLNGKSRVAPNSFISLALKYRNFILEELY